MVDERHEVAHGCVLGRQSGGSVIRSLQMAVEEREDLFNDDWVRDVHMGHVWLNNEPMFESNFFALGSQTFHLSHAEPLVECAHTKKYWRIVGSYVGDSAVDAAFLDGVTVQIPLSFFALCTSNFVEEAVLDQEFLGMLAGRNQRDLKTVRLPGVWPRIFFPLPVVDESRLRGATGTLGMSRDPLLSRQVPL
jgi:hypothetical protein